MEDKIPGEMHMVEGGAVRVLRGLAIAAMFAVLASPSSAEDQITNAAPGASASDTIETVVVTARRRAENAQDVPIALSVLSGAQIESSGYSNLQDIYRQVPSLKVVDTNPRNVGMTIRGIGANLASESLVNSVGVFVDGVYYMRPGASAFDMMDIDQIEVLRGPQGTLFGKNTTAGALNITTRRPSFTPELDIDASGGDFGYYKFAATASDALTDDLAGRVTASISSRDGTIDNVRSHRKLNNANDKSVRGELLYNATENLSVFLSADYGYQNINCCVDVLTGSVTHYDNGAVIPNNFATRAAHVGYTPLPFDPFARNTDIDSQQHYRLEQWGYSAQVNWTTFGGHTVTAITAFRNWRFDPYNDLDLIGIPILTQGAFHSHSHTFSQELRIASPTGGAVDYVAGIYYLYDVLASTTIQTFGADAGGWILPTLPLSIVTPALNDFSGVGDDRSYTSSIAGFAQATWHITPAIDLAGGLRYTNESKWGYSEQSATGGAPLSTFPIGLQPTIAVIRAASAPTFDTRTIAGFPQSHSEGDLSGTGSATWKITEDVTAYASYSRGYKSGGINFGVNVPTSSTVIHPEIADDYEIGLKSTWFDKMLQLNLAAFWTDVKDYQSTRIFVSPAGATTIYIFNVPKIRSRGLEADAYLAPVDGLLIGLSGSYTDAYYVSDPSDQCSLVNPAGVCSLTGRQLANASKWSGYLSATYDSQFSFGQFHESDLRPFVSADVSFRSSFYSGASAESFVPSYAVADMSIGLRLSDHSTELSFWVHNLFDENYFLYKTPLIFNNGTIEGRLGDPRMIGVTLRQHF
jgi:iron complex outermembrane receptor protein